MKRAIAVAAILLTMAIFSRPAFPADGPIAAVRTEPLGKRELASTITGYGTVGTDPRNTTTINFPYAVQITRLPVILGEVVRKGAPLVEVSVSPSDAMGFALARSNLEFARAELARVQSMADQQLATRSRLDQAKKNVIDAERALAVQRKLGTDKGSTLISAPFAGVISMVNAAPGDRVPAGTTVVQLARQDRLRVVVGIEPEEMGRIRPGMPVRVSSVFDERVIIAGRVEKVFGMINPQTRLVDVSVALSPGQSSALVAGTRVKGVITLNRRKEYAVPRSALLKDAGGAYLFVVRNGRAHRVAVTPGVESGGMVAVNGRIAPGERVVVLGNYELRNGMEVREEGK
ncbi:efflux RND transporter periplasmic adaptor subunit [Geobacter sp.]|uniref:efflux RND transporter periplasmic adaptor subunit n=1 Tax=Geobacter sp. TaxID=46610 RepID=UPI00261FD31A|nr:efflux RND transporter periplasmic adaptor subunit [Geobacter sp.]